VLLTPGQQLIITTDDIEGDGSAFQPTTRDCLRICLPGIRSSWRIGLIELRVDETGPGKVICRVINGGLLGEHKGINVPGAMLSAPSMTEKDHLDLKFGLEHEVDYLALSFVRSANDLREAKTPSSDWARYAL
jgi:pyruvate kinase